MKTDTSKSWFKRHEKAIAFSISAVFVIIGLYFERDNIKQLGIPLSFNDLVQALGQLATVGAFWLGFSQLKKSNVKDVEQRRKKHQDFFYKAAETRLTKMVSELQNVESSSITIPRLMDCLERLIGQQNDFLTLYSELDHSIHKQQITAAWQEIFYGEFRTRLGGITVFSLIGSYVTIDSITAARLYAADQQQTNKHPDETRIFWEYFHIFEVVDEHIPSALVRDLLRRQGIFTLLHIYFFINPAANGLQEYNIISSDIKEMLPAITALEFWLFNIDEPEES